MLRQQRRVVVIGSRGKRGSRSLFDRGKIKNWFVIIMVVVV
jgi:hypothetical protein